MPPTRASPPNRRSSRRQGLRTACSVILAGRTPMQLTTSDVGLDGLSLTSHRPVPPGTRCTLRFELRAGVAVESAAKVVYSSYRGAEGFKIGLMFVDLPDPAAAAIEAFIAH